MKIGKFVSDLKFKVVNRIQAAKYGKTDFGIVKVAYMVAALDGEISEAELKALGALVKKCRGYSKKAADKALADAMRSAGYLMLFAKSAKDADLVKAFVKEAQAALPDGFAYFSVEDVRRAVVTWIAMGMSDGDYSRREKLCIEALRKCFAELNVRREKEDLERWLALSPAFRQAYAPGSLRATVAIVPKDFVTRVEQLVALYGEKADAAKELEKLITAE